MLQFMIPVDKFEHHISQIEPCATFFSLSNYKKYIIILKTIYADFSVSKPLIHTLCPVH